MGMFDYIACKVQPALGDDFQTKSLNCTMDQYEIREDGSLWFRDYDIEDRSAAARFAKANPGVDIPVTLDRFFGCMSRVNMRWVPYNHTGEIQFDEWSAYFVNGRLAHPIVNTDEIGVVKR